MEQFGDALNTWWRTAPLDEEQPGETRPVKNGRPNPDTRVPQPNTSPAATDAAAPVTPDAAPDSSDLASP